MAVIYTATVGGKTYGFDFSDQRIDVDATVDSMTVTDLYTAIKQAQASVEGMAYNEIAHGSGRNILGAGVETYLTVTLFENWEVLTLKASGKFEVFGGNLIRDDQGNPFRDNALITYISFMSQAGIATQIETGVSGLTTEESDQLLALGTALENADSVWAHPDAYKGTNVSNQINKLNQELSLQKKKESDKETKMNLLISSIERTNKGRL